MRYIYLSIGHEVLIAIVVSAVLGRSGPSRAKMSLMRSTTALLVEHGPCAGDIGGNLLKLGVCLFADLLASDLKIFLFPVTRPDATREEDWGRMSSDV